MRRPRDRAGRRPFTNVAAAGSRTGQLLVACVLLSDEQSMTASLSEVFSADGPLAAAVPGYRPRSQQLATRRAHRRGDGRQPCAGRRGRDRYRQDLCLPRAGAAFGWQGDRVHGDAQPAGSALRARHSDHPQGAGSPVKVALLKGRANYLCHYHLARSLADGRFLSREDAAYAQRIARFARRRAVATRPSVPTCRKLPRCGRWSPRRATTASARTVRNHKECFVLAARREALAADLVVVNHHLFFADVMLRDEGTAELLPACNTVIFDEAHQLPEVASLFFGDSVSTAQLLELARDTRSEGVAAARDCLDLPRLCDQLEKATSRPAPDAAARTGALRAAATHRTPGFADALATVIGDLEALAALLETQAQRAKGSKTAGGVPASCWRACNPGRAAQRRLRPLGRDLQPLAAAQRDAAGDCRDHAEADERPSAGLDLHFGDARRAEGFRPLLRRDGTGEACSARWESPFDYPRQALLYAPRNLPDPNSRDYAEAVVGPLFRCSGRAAAAPSSCAPRCGRCAGRMSCSSEQLRAPGSTCRAAAGRAARTNCSSAFAVSAMPS
jgi:ATP-dependent DNA helicase DinG